MLQIEQIIAQTAEHLFDGIGVAVIKGSVGGNARSDLEQIAVTGIALHDLFDVEFAFGTGADKGHLPAEDIPKLGKLVKVMFTQEFPDFGHALVFTAGIESGSVFLGIELHATELVNVERTTKTADTFLLEDGRSPVFSFYGNIAEQEQGGEYNHGNQSYQAVDNTFGITFETIHAVWDEMVIFFNVFKIYHNFVLFE